LTLLEGALFLAPLPTPLSNRLQGFSDLFAEGRFVVVLNSWGKQNLPRIKGDHEI
jgi:hypothetical protein